MIEELWANPQVRSVVIGIVAMLIISVCKKYSTAVNESTAYKYVAVSVLSIIAALFVQLYAGTVVDVKILLTSSVTIFASAITGYQTIGRVAKTLLEQYELRKNGE